MVPLEGFEPPSDTLEEWCLVQLDHSGIGGRLENRTLTLSDQSAFETVTDPVCLIFHIETH